MCEFALLAGTSVEPRHSVSVAAPLWHADRNFPSIDELLDVTLRKNGSDCLMVWARAAVVAKAPMMIVDFMLCRRVLIVEGK